MNTPSNPTKNASAPPNQSGLMRMTLVFALIFGALHLSYQASEGSLIETLIIDKATVIPSTLIINQISPELKVQALEHRLVSQQARLSVLNGCEGTEMLFLIIAAVLAFKCSPKTKLLGLAGGIGVIYILNQARIVALYFSLLEDKAMFEAIHGIIGPTVIVLLAALFYLGWVKWAVSYDHQNNVAHS